MGSKLTYRLKKSLLRSAKGRAALRHREKQRAKPQNFPEEWVGERVQ